MEVKRSQSRQLPANKGAPPNWARFFDHAFWNEASRLSTRLRHSGGLGDPNLRPHAHGGFAPRNGRPGRSPYPRWLGQVFRGARCWTFEDPSMEQTHHGLLEHVHRTLFGPGFEWSNSEGKSLAPTWTKLAVEIWCSFLLHGFFVLFLWVV